MLQVDAPSDRWVTKILSFPCFDDLFRESVTRTHLSNLQLVLAMEVCSESEFAAKVLEWSPSLAPDHHKALAARPEMLEQFWVFTKAAEAVFSESFCFQLGMSQTAKVARTQGADAASELRKRSALLALLAPVRSPKPKLLGPGSSSSNSPLLDQEMAEKLKWARRLEDIATRAGPFAGIIEDHCPAGEGPEILSSLEKERLKSLVLTAGAPSTMSGHVRRFERFECWADRHSIPFFPITEDKVLKYALFLDQQECGPTVIPSLRTALRWVGFRISMKVPGLSKPQFLALENEVFAKRGRPLKEALPYPLELIKLMEAFVLEETFVPARLFIWWVLCMIFASLRFDDAVHVKPSELEMTDDGLFGVSWQTKTERKRRGTKFIVPDVSFSDKPWLQEGWKLFLQEVSPQARRRDFWMADLASQLAFGQDAPTHGRGLQWLHFLLHGIAKKAGAPSAVLGAVSKLTWHSARVTMLDQAVHLKRSTEEIGLQANWKNPGPLVLKYTRSRTSVPAVMIREIVTEIKRAYHPKCAQEDDEIEDGEEAELSLSAFFMKAPEKCSSSYEYKFHCCSADSIEELACRKVRDPDFINIGSVLPDAKLLCKLCAKARPDIVKLYSGAT